MPDVIAPDSRREIAPYAILFPIGIANAIAGASLWIVHSFGLIEWPSRLHPVLMVEGFELSFVMGFLLTALPAFTRGARAHLFELRLAVASVLLVDVCALAGLLAAAHAACAVGLGTLLVAGIRRVRHPGHRPPEEFLFAALGFVLGLFALGMMIGVELGWWIEPQPRFGSRLLSLGFVMSVVLGVGSLLVPTFSGMRDPLEIPGLAKAHERAPRRALYLPLIAMLIAAFVLEAFGFAQIGAFVRAAVGLTMGLLVWKLWRKPALATVPAWVLWSSGWCVMVGLVLAACGPAWALGGEHVIFIGGFGLVTLGVATRVVTSHGGHPLAIEPGVLDWPLFAGIVLALALRVSAELAPAYAVPLLGASGAAWTLTWGWWAKRVFELLARPSRPLLSISKPQA